MVGQPVDDGAFGEDLACEESEDGWEYPSPLLLVRVLGVPSVPDRPQLARRRTALGLVVYLACQGRPTPREKVIDAVWGGELRTAKTLNNTAYEARAALGNWPDGSPVLPSADQASGTITLHPSATTDLAVMRALVHRAREVSSAHAVVLLRDALALVQGEPFDAVGYEWAEAEQHVTEARELIETASRTLFDLACQDNDPATARFALTQGHKGLPANEHITRLSMQLEHRQGNTAGVHQVWTQLDRQLRVIDAEPSTETVALYRQLVRAQPSPQHR